MTPALLGAIALVQMVFLGVTAAFIVLHRRRALQRAMQEAQSRRLLQGPLQRWLLGEGDVAVVASTLAAMPHRLARAAAGSLVRANVPAAALDELAHRLRLADWAVGTIAGTWSLFWWRRLEAARLLSDVGLPERDRPLVRTLLGDPHPAVQVAAAACLTRLGDAELVERLLDLLPDRSGAVRLFQLGVLRDRWTETDPAVVRRLDAGGPGHVLERYVAVAEAIETPDALAAVARVRRHPDAPVRIAAARALKRYFHPDSEAALRELLIDDDWRVRAQAARSLGVLRAAGAVDTLADRLSDPAWWVRFRSALALAQLGEPGRRVLRAARTHTDRFAADMATMVTGLAEGALLELAEG